MIKKFIGITLVTASLCIVGAGAAVKQIDFDPYRFNDLELALSTSDMSFSRSNSNDMTVTDFMTKTRHDIMIGEFGISPPIYQPKETNNWIYGFYLEQTAKYKLWIQTNEFIALHLSLIHI